METSRPDGLLAWQWALYPEGHRDRRNLLVHVLTVPVFMAGTTTLVVSPYLGAASAVAGLLAMIGAMALQGLTHRREARGPEPFQGPIDVVSRILAEQWITFPRYVLTGGLARAWRAASPADPPPKRKES